jgi:hypothetical protein
MGVRKFRSVEAMKGPQPLRPLDPENLRIACGLSSLELLAPVRRTPGVRKFRSVEEMSRERDRRDREQTPKSGTDRVPRI